MPRAPAFPNCSRVTQPAPQSTDTAPEPTVLVVATDRVEYDPAYFEKGVTVIVGGQLANPFDPTAGHKTVAYWSRLSLLRRAASMRASEAIVLAYGRVVARARGGSLERAELEAAYARAAGATP